MPCETFFTHPRMKLYSWLTLVMHSIHSLTTTELSYNGIGIICPSLAQILTILYGYPVRLLVAGGGEITSTEGTKQGDPLAMTMYSVAITPLIDLLRESCPDILKV